MQVVWEIPLDVPEILTRAFTQGLKGRDFFHSLSKKSPIDFDILLARTEKYINMEESQRARQESRGLRVAKLPECRIEPVILARPVMTCYPIQDIPLRFSKERAMQICAEHRLLRRPAGATRGPQKCPTPTFCSYHQEYGHTTQECQQLDRELERVVESIL